MHIAIRGAVQGVGFRPFIFRLATELHLPGWVVNSAQGVFIEVEGEEETLTRFLLRVRQDAPPRSFIQSLEYSLLDPRGFSSFEIRQSTPGGEKTAYVLPDVATCPDCLAEILDLSNRRYLYPFTNCTNCGPRFSIIEALPYDRESTTMKEFTMCDACRREYEDPLDRRFHAQPNACPVCGPHLELQDSSARTLSSRHDALLGAVKAIREGRIVALKGLGGFQLVVDAGNEQAVGTLRVRKHRVEKPFALMFPSLDSVRRECVVDRLEEQLLLSPESPIVLLARQPSATRGKTDLAPSVAPHNPLVGAMLPYTPLHHILMRELGSPLVATSGNISDEPICIEEREALVRLHGIADCFLIHNRPIYRHVDDSVVRIMLGRELIMRRARGYAPLPITVRRPMPDMLAVGPHLKNTVAIARGSDVFISQHIGDLETAESYSAFRREVASLQQLYEITPVRVVSDLHPDYLSTKYAGTLGVPVIAVQHHYAHVASCMAENGLEGRVLGVSWDGTGYGTDGTIWGGEFLLTNSPGFDRYATFRRFPLPGGDAAVKEPRRAALGILYAMLGEGVLGREDLKPLLAFSPHELAILRQVLRKSVNAPFTTSAGRLFDAVASLIGLRQRCSFEGQAAMELEFLTTGIAEEKEYEFQLLDVRGDTGNSLELESRDQEPRFILDWSPMIRGILEDLDGASAPGTIAMKFHNTLAGLIVRVAQLSGQERIVLTGGCFQNRTLTEQTVQRLRAAGFRPYWHQRVPPNDGGISLGQLSAAAMVFQDL